MYDDGPPDPEPNPCPYCEAELGYGEGCTHCAMAEKLAEVEGEHSTLKRRLACRARNLAWLPAGVEFQARRAEGIALLLDLAGLKLPADYLAQARATMTGEYGEHLPYGKQGGSVQDAHIVDRFMEWAHAEAVAASPALFTGEILSARPATRADQLWWGDDAQGVPRIFTDAEKRLGRCGGSGSSQGGLTLRETIERALDAEAKGAEFWLEFYREYLKPPASLVPPEDPRFVRGGDQPKVSFVVGTTAYTAYPGQHKSEHDNGRHLGFGGSEWTVRLADGREFFTDNNWHRGTVPPHLRKLMPSNAVFVTKQLPANEPQPEAATTN
jgi:hypothetical protein